MSADGRPTSAACSGRSPFLARAFNGNQAHLSACDEVDRHARHLKELGPDFAFSWALVCFSLERRANTGGLQHKKVNCMYGGFGGLGYVWRLNLHAWPCSPRGGRRWTRSGRVRRDRLQLIICNSTSVFYCQKQPNSVFSARPPRRAPVPGSALRNLELRSPRGRLGVEG